MTTIVHMIDLEYNQKPICPYCGRWMLADQEMFLTDGEETEVICEHCDKFCVLTAHIPTPTYSTKKIEGEDN